ncbi:MAG TPA: DsbA family protein [Hanamia sp.]|nr:DsbA family protein [Hanamia sp.]
MLITRNTQKPVDIKRQQNKHTPPSTADQLEIIYFTDPLCCWSWAMEPQLRKIQYEYNGQINWRYCMGGLLPGWDNYHDEINSVSRPIQMGPVWMHAQYVSGMPMDANIWMKDPPASSYPACIAMKNASMQSGEAGARYLRLLREAVMIRGENIAKGNVLIDIADRLSHEEGYNFSATIFRQQLKEDNALEAFRNDLHEVQYQQVKRFPTFIIKRSQQGIILTGYRPYENLREALLQISPAIEKNNPVINPAEYETFWCFITDKEMEAIIVNE